MGDIMTYKHLTGSIEISREDQCFYEKILGIRDLVLYEGNTLDELESDFHQMTDEYLALRKDSAQG
ncbi:MAG: antitoxin HicB [Clostridiales bacterium]|nr:antitoxin HicB [Clostridiales bacterium]